MLQLWVNLLGRTVWKLILQLIYYVKPDMEFNDGGKNDWGFSFVWRKIFFESMKLLVLADVHHALHVVILHKVSILLL